jgi:hypothetical protein
MRPVDRVCSTHDRAGSSNDWLGAALHFAAPAPSMRDAARRTTCSSCLGEARVLAPACPLHALCSGPCRLELTWCSHPLGTVCLRRARCRSPCRSCWSGSTATELLFKSESLTPCCWSGSTATELLFKSESLMPRCLSGPTSKEPLFVSKPSSLRCWSIFWLALRRLWRFTTVPLIQSPTPLLFPLPLQLRLPLPLSYAGLSPFGVRDSDCG